MIASQNISALFRWNIYSRINSLHSQWIGEGSLKTQKESLNN